MYRTARRALLATMVAGVLAVAGTTAAPAEAAKIFRVVAVPGSVSFGFTPSAVVLKAGSPLWFTNLDTALHNVVSTSGPGVFSSALVGFNVTVPVNGAQNLANGKYPFLCTLHPNMRGTLTVKG